MHGSSSREHFSANTPENALDFVIERYLKGKLNTALPVRVVAVNPGKVGPCGTVDVMPLVGQLDGEGNALAPQTIHGVPYTRIQGGVAAVIVDPEPGDIGLAVFCQRDISSAMANKGSANPGSFRTFDQADAWYIGGGKNKTPEIYLELKQEGVATLRAPLKIILDSPLVELTGVLSQGTGEGAGGESTFNGRIKSTGDQVAGTVSQMGHVHEGVQAGGDTTGRPEQ